MWDLHSHRRRNIPGGHADLCSLSNFPWPGRHLLSGRSMGPGTCSDLFAQEGFSSSFPRGEHRGFVQAGLLTSSNLEKEAAAALGIIRILKKILKMQAW